MVAVVISSDERQREVQIRKGDWQGVKMWYLPPIKDCQKKPWERDPVLFCNLSTCFCHNSRKTKQVQTLTPVLSIGSEYCYLPNGPWK